MKDIMEVDPTLEVKNNLKRFNSESQNNTDNKEDNSFYNMLNKKIIAREKRIQELLRIISFLENKVKNYERYISQAPLKEEIVIVRKIPRIKKLDITSLDPNSRNKRIIQTYTKSYSKHKLTYETIEIPRYNQEKKLIQMKNETKSVWESFKLSVKSIFSGAKKNNKINKPVTNINNKQKVCSEYTKATQFRKSMSNSSNDYKLNQGNNKEIKQSENTEKGNILDRYA